MTTAGTKGRNPNLKLTIFVCCALYTYFKKKCTDKKENQIFLIYKEIQSGAVAKSCMGKGFLIHQEMRKYFPVHEEAVSHV